MTATSTRPALTPPARPRDIVLLVCLAGLSGAALLARAWWGVPMSWTAGFAVLPGTVAIVVVVFASRGQRARAHIVSDRVIAGANWGLVATLVYDVVRPVLVWALHLHFNPFRAQAIFGHLITGRPRTSGLAIGVGWLYHFWNGVSFGVMLALIRPRGAWAVGLVWAMALQGLMMAIYPNLLQVRLDNPGFLVTTIVGHGVYGVVLGSSLKHWGPR